MRCPTPSNTIGSEQETPAATFGTKASTPGGAQRRPAAGGAEGAVLLAGDSRVSLAGAAVLRSDNFAASTATSGFMIRKTVCERFPDSISIVCFTGENPGAVASIE